MKPITIPDSKAEELFRIYGAGTQEDGKIVIDPLEALYFIEKKKLAIDGETFDSIFAKARAEDALAEEKYAVLKQLRQNGYILRLSFADEPWVRVYRKGFRPGEDRTQYLLKIVKQGWHPKLEELVEDMKRAAEVRKELVYAIASGGKVQFFKTSRTSFD